ncbi:putative F-box-containing protein [Namao virus]|nr:putative F-box-containing protein [Namao virus]
MQLETESDLLTEILLRVSCGDLRRCRCVCAAWRDTVDRAWFWRRRCQRENIGHSTTPSDWRAHYLLCRYRRNLVANPSAGSGLLGWAFEEWPPGFEAQCMREGERGAPAEVACFVSRDTNCSMTQTVDLVCSGYSREALDAVRPALAVSWWYFIPTRDPWCDYRVQIRLRSETGATVERFDAVVNVWSMGDHTWHDAAHVFREYRAGVRYVEIGHTVCYYDFDAETYSGMRVTRSAVEVLSPWAHVE